MSNKLQELTEPLDKEDIEIRVGNCGEKGASLLLYKTARADTKRFNKVFGLQWKREHRIENNYYICRISIFDNDIKEWINREDVGTESNTEKEKGGFSDAFKRAGFSFGVGIELYDAPFILIPGITCKDEAESKRLNKTKYKLQDRFYCDKLCITKYNYLEDKRILEIEISKGSTVVFTNFKQNNSISTSNNMKPKLNNDTIPSKTDTKHKSCDEYKRELRQCHNLDELKIIFLDFNENKNNFTEEERQMIMEIKDEMKNELTKE